MSASTASAEAHARWKIPATTSIIIGNPALSVTQAKEKPLAPLLFWAAIPFALMDAWFAATMPRERLVGGQPGSATETNDGAPR